MLGGQEGDTAPAIAVTWWTILVDLFDGTFGPVI